MDNQNIAAPEKPACPYCKALEIVNDPSEGSCPYCEAMNGEATAVGGTENCKYCANMADDASCKYCDAMNSEPAAPGCAYCSDMVSRDQECPTCGQPPLTQNPTTTNSEDFAGQDLDSPALPKPIMGEDPQGQITPMDDTTNNNANLDGHGEANVQTVPVIPSVNANQPQESVQTDHSKEAMMQIAQQIEGDAGITPGAGPGPAGQAVADNTDQASLAVGTSMEDNVSRPSGYDQDNDSDLGNPGGPQTSGAPDLTSVLHEGLDAHADNIQREKVVQMVSQALSGFKASKKIIEMSQTQAPQFYQASIMMLKAMIEMAKMLGLGPQNADAPNPLAAPGSEWQNPFPTHPDQGGTQQPGHAPSAGSASQDGDANNGNDWNTPFATHPDQGGTPQPGHAPSAGTTVGQPIGKLPTSATTEHVARTPLAPGAVNAKGQKKYVDPATGEESFIDMKEGRVLSPTGKPVKPSHQG